MYPVLDKHMTGRRIRRLMDSRGISVKDVQQYLGLSCVQSVYHWLDGSSMPTLDNIYALSELLQEPVDAMLCGNRTLCEPADVMLCGDKGVQEPNPLCRFGTYGRYGGYARRYYSLLQSTAGLSDGICMIWFPQAELDVYISSVA